MLQFICHQNTGKHSLFENQMTKERKKYAVCSQNCEAFLDLNGVSLKPCWFELLTLFWVPFHTGIPCIFHIPTSHLLTLWPVWVLTWSNCCRARCVFFTSCVFNVGLQVIKKSTFCCYVHLIKTQGTEYINKMFFLVSFPQLKCFVFVSNWVPQTSWDWTLGICTLLVLCDKWPQICCSLNYHIESFTLNSIYSRLTLTQAMGCVFSLNTYFTYRWEEGITFKYIEDMACMTPDDTPIWYHIGKGVVTTTTAEIGNLCAIRLHPCVILFLSNPESFMTIPWRKQNGWMGSDSQNTTHIMSYTTVWWVSGLGSLVTVTHKPV